MELLTQALVEIIFCIFAVQFYEYQFHEYHMIVIRYIKFHDYLPTLSHSL